MPTPQTTNIGLYIFQGAADADPTPDGSSVLTAGTYPYLNSANMSALDLYCYGANNLVPTAGLDIDANLSLNSYSLTAVGSITATGTISATTGTIAGATLKFNTANSYTSANTMTIAPNVASAGTSVIINNTVSMSSGTLLSLQNDGTVEISFNHEGDISLAGSIFQSTASTGQLIQGNAQTGGTGITLNSGTHSMSSGTLVAFENDGSVESYVDYAGNIWVTANVGGVFQETASTALTLTGNCSATGVGVVLNSGSTNVTTGALLAVENNSVQKFAISGYGHLISGGSAPTGATAAGATNTYWGLATGTTLSVTGNDVGCYVTVTTGGGGTTQTSIPANTGIFTITLGNAYSSGNYIAICTYRGGGGGTPGTSSFYCTPTSASVFVVYNTTAFTPAASTSYAFDIFTISAGASS